MIINMLRAGAIITALFASVPGLWRYSQPWPALALGAGWLALRKSPPALANNAVMMAGAAHSLAVIAMPSPLGRPGGYFGNANTAGAALAALLIFAVGNWRRDGWIWAAIIAAGLVYTQSLGAILGAGAGIAALGAASGPVRAFIGRHKRLIALGALGAALALGVVILGMAQGRPYWPDRLDFWQSAIRLIRANPWGGNGRGSFMLDQFVSGFDPDWSRVKPQIQPHAHNLILHIWAEYGAAGLALAALGLGLAYRKTNRPGRAALAGMIVHGFVDATPLYLPVALALGVVVYQGRRG